MAVDKNKVTAEATKLIQKGQFDKAIRAYEKILADDPRDVRVLLKVGELQQKKGDNRAAAETFGRVADAYSEQGFFLKAVAVYKQMLKLAPEDVRVNERLAALYQQLGILSDAMAQLQLVAAAAERANDGNKLLDVLKRMIELDPDNVASAVKLGELYARTGQPKLALEHLRRAADSLKRTSRSDEYLKVAERIAFLAPDDLALTRELANLYLARGDTKRALAKLQLCFKADSKDAETLALLAQAFKDLGQLSKTTSVYKELAHLYAEKGRVEEARATWRRVLEIAPDDADALAAVAPPRAAPAPAADPVALPRGAAPPPAAVPRAAPRPVPVLVAPAAAPAPAAPAEPAGAPRPLGPEAVAKLLTETDVYVKYGLLDKALDHLQKVFSIDPEHLDAREKALAIRVARGDRSGAADEALRCARTAVARGLTERARSALERLRDLAPAHPELADLTRAAEPASAPASPAGAPAEEELVLEVDAPTATETDSLALSAAAAEGEEVADEEPFAFDVAPPAPPSAEAGPDRAAPVAGARVPAVIGDGAAQAAAGLAGGPDLADELAEIDFFVQQRLYDDALEALGALLEAHPGHPGLAARRADIEALAGGAAPGSPAGRDAFDIGRELADELGDGDVVAAADDSSYSAGDVFSQFKRGVEQAVNPEDAETHYDLGIAYKEMGLLDDALHEFDVALSAKSRREVDCLTMIALCRAEKGDVKGAVQAYRRALGSDQLTPDAARAIHYDLGAAYEVMGDREAALHYFHRTLRTDPGFRDARARVDRLGGGPGRPPHDEPAPPPRPGEASGGAARGPKKNIGYL